MFVCPLFSTVLGTWAVLYLVVESCAMLCDLIDCSPPGCSVHGILQARILEWVAMPSSRGSSHPRNWTRVSCNVGGFYQLSYREALLVHSRHLTDISQVNDQARCSYEDITFAFLCFPSFLRKHKNWSLGKLKEIIEVSLNLQLTGI